MIRIILVRVNNNIKELVVRPSIMQDTEPVTFYNVHTQPFSNFFPSPFTADGKEYPTAEHYYQSKKFANTELQEVIRKASTIAECHLLGQQYHPAFDFQVWDEERTKVYEEAVRHKFSQNEGLAKRLRETGEREIICIDQDSFWGMRFDDQLGKMVGGNITGKILMKVRTELKPEKEEKDL